MITPALTKLSIAMSRRRRGACSGLLGISALCSALCQRANAQNPATPPGRAPDAGASWLERLGIAKTRPDTEPRVDTLPVPGRKRVACMGQRIDDIVVITQPPYTNGLLGRVAFIGRTVRSLHATTRSDVVRRFLLLHPGDPCNEAELRESERILRAQPYLVDARITAYNNDEGGVLLEVETRDEFSGIIQMAARTRAPVVTNLRLGEANLAGAGLYTSAQWYDGGPGYRDGFAARIIDYQFMGRPWRLTVQGARKDVGDEWWTDLTHPFYTDFQRVAWRAVAGGRSDFLEMLRPAPDRNSLFFRREYGALGGVWRVGAPGRLSLFGASLSTERANTDDRVRVLSDTGMTPDRGPPIGFRPADMYPSQRVVRANALLGYRHVRFLGATGFDALTGRQDVRRGVQISSVVGRGLSALGSRDHDLFLSTDVYGGAGSTRSFAAVEIQGEGRNDFEANRWVGMVASGRAAWYIVPDERWRTVASVEYAGTWRPRVPIQLALGAIDGGVRGFDGALAAGAQRIVGRFEERWVLGTPFGLGDVGIAGFLDAGRTVAGQAPYGVTTPVQAAVGLGVLGAFPPHSRRMWRVDIALPITHTPGSKFQVLFSNRDMTRLFWREPKDVVVAREQAVPASVFSWP